MTSLDHMFFEYGEENIRRWCTSLKIFRLCKTYPYPNDMHPDRFIASIQFSTDDELDRILQNLELTENTDKPEQSRFRLYNEHSFAGWQLLNGLSCYMSINKLLQVITLEVSGIKGDQFKLDETTFERAKKIEEFILKLDLVFIIPPQDDNYCICPKYYPKLWEK
ncbi:MAG: hypothetical protein KGD59_04170 [Candidatus Heimdallarchaeota archaeon]|nr:hypothetical protein [Candidatus Heimdallarchaeota archaeon]MBY8993722.1 hypothetical protein [Candidatus Heimdallarchaeota archaeon]